MPEKQEDRRKGLSGLPFLPPDEGMLFDFSDHEDIVPEMYMKDTTIPLDMIGISDDVVVQVVTPEPESETLIPFPNVEYVLEVNAGSNITIGKEVDIDDDEEHDKYVLKVLAPDGTAQALLQGGERIFSRVSTRRLITKSKKAHSVRKDKDKYERECKKLGKYLFQELHNQDSREKQYVTKPEEDK